MSDEQFFLPLPERRTAHEFEEPEGTSGAARVSRHRGTDQHRCSEDQVFQPGTPFASLFELLCIYLQDAQVFPRIHRRVCMQAQHPCLQGIYGGKAIRDQ